MYTQTTEGIEVSVRAEYKGIHRVDRNFVHAFAYHIRIENGSDRAVKLLSRLWWIYDSQRPVHQVEGSGVVGARPELMPGASFQYSSACHLHGAFGAMKGHYRFSELGSDKQLDVEIPRFQLMPDHLRN